MADPYVYLGTDILINKLDIRDAQALEGFERTMTAGRMRMGMPEVELTPGGFRALHRHLFQDVYSWAGEDRSVPLFKNGDEFCRPQFIAGQLEKRFAAIRSESHLRGLEQDQFAARAGEHLSELNAIHPFREGNGRAMQALLVRLGRDAGHQIDLSRIDSRQWNEASRQSFWANSDAMRDVVRQAIIGRSPTAVGRRDAPAESRQDRAGKGSDRRMPARSPQTRLVDKGNPPRNARRMADLPRDKQSAKRRASFARAERLRREVEKGGSKPKVSKRDPAKPPSRSAEIRAALRTREKQFLALARTPAERERIKRMFAHYHRVQDTVDGKRSAVSLKAVARREEQKKAEQSKKQDQAKKIEQRRQQQRKDADKKRVLRVAEQRKQQAARTAEQRRQEQLKAIARRAKAEIEAAHKRQRDEQQQAHRRETDQMRKRHKMERDSFRSNETAAIERHAGAIRRLDAAELRELDNLAVRHKSLPGRIAAFKPGATKARETARQAIRDRYEADRIRTHRDHEAYKERQFDREQATRLQHARERLVGMQSHRENREGLTLRQEAERPRLTEQRQQALVAAQEQSRVQERAPIRDKWQAGELTQTFSRGREISRGPAPP